MLIRTNEEYLAKYGNFPLNSTGTPLEIGLEVEHVIKSYVEVGTRGVIVGYDSSMPSNPGVAYYESMCSSFHNLSGLITEYKGLWQRPEALIVVPKVKGDEEEALKNSLLKSTQDTKTLLLEGKFYNLELTPNQKADELVSSLMRAVATRVSQIRQRANAQILAAEQKAREVLALPEINTNDLKKGLMVYKIDGRLAYVMPMHYAPKYLGSSRKDMGKEVCKQLSEEHRKKLEDDVLFVVQVLKDGQLYCTQTLKQNFEPFEHYHGDSNDCLGSVSPTSPILKPSDAFALRDRYQKALELINKDSLYNDAPIGLLGISTLERDAEATITIDPWAKAKEKTVEDTIQVGSMVKVIKDYDNLVLVGVIAKVVDIQDSNFGLEFLDEIPAGHDCDRKGVNRHCWYFKIEHLELMPPGTRRTHLPTPATSGWVTSTTTSTSDMTRAEQFAKFGIHGTNDDMSIICRRCAGRWGDHYGSDGGVCICPDEHRAGREVENLDVHVERTWASPPYETLEEVRA